LVIIAARHGRRYLSTGWFWYLGTLLPVIGLVQVGGQSMADRYTYLPSIGLFIMVGWCGADLALRWPRIRRPLVATAAIVAILLTFVTKAQVRHWRDSFTLYGHALEVTEDNWLAYYNLGRAELLAGKVEEGIPHLEQAVRLIPESSDAHNNLGVALNTQGRYDEAIIHFGEAVRIDPESARAHNNLGQALGLSDRLTEAIPHFETAIRLQPNLVKGYYNLCFAYSEQGQLDRALRFCEAALRIKPGYAQAAQLRTLILQRQRQ